MSELRLVPAALAVWGATLVTLLLGWPWAAAYLGVLAGLCWWLRQDGQAIAVAALGATSALVAHVRRHRAEEFGCPERGIGKLASRPTYIEQSDSWLLRVKVPGYPTELPVFIREEPPTAPGTHLRLTLECSESTRPGVGAMTARGSIENTLEPSGFAAWSAQVAESFRELVIATVGPASQGLLPGMVLGDTSLQAEAEKQLYIDTGLSHLSAVSGANVAVVCSMAALACGASGPRVRIGVSLAALFVFVGLVGFEPSVLRASVAGVVGLLAVLNSARMQPIHALCLGIIGLVLWDSDLAVHFGFALSVAATAGIVVLSPLIYAHLTFTRWPAILLRAIAVAIAADMVTMPIIALMAGEVSLVSVLANILVAPATAPVTVLGLLAAGLAQLGPLKLLGAAALKLIEPCTWWINTVAHGTAALPLATIPAEPHLVLLAYGWILAGLLYRRPLMESAG